MSKDNNVKVNLTKKAQVELVKKVSAAMSEAVTTIFEATDVGNILGVYDDFPDFNTAEIAADAASYVVDKFIGSLCYNVIDPKRFGQATLNRAFDDLARANEQVELSPTPQADDNLNRRIRWTAQVECQLAYRQALQQFAMGVYSLLNDGEIYQIPAQKADSASHSATTKAASKMLARRAATS